MTVDWPGAIPLLISSGVAVALVGLDRGLASQAEKYYGDPKYEDRAAPHMVRNFVEWWMDLLSLIGAGLSAVAAAVLLGEPSERVALGALSAMYLCAALLASLIVDPFEYRARFRLLRRTINRYNTRFQNHRILLGRPKTSPAFTLVMVGNAIGLLFTISL
jgi:hypothetical protein